MTAPTVYRSSDTSAPVLDGQNGSLVTVLDACLVNGYGSKAAAGWTKAFSGTSKAAYRQAAGNQFYVRVQDDGPGAGTGKEARVVGYETMSGIDTGTNLFPTAAQQANGLFVRKSVAADATARPWIVVADDRTVYMFVLTGDSSGVYLAWMFGDFYSFKSSDAGRTILISRGSENSGTITGDNLDLQVGAISSTISGHYIARATDGSVGAIAAAKAGDLGLSADFATPGALIGIATFTNPADNRILLGQVRVTQTSGGNQHRGRMRGFWHFGHAVTNASDGDTFSGAGDLAGKTFLVIKSSGNSALYIIETSNTWETN